MSPGVGAGPIRSVATAKVGHAGTLPPSDPVVAVREAHATRAGSGGFAGAIGRCTASPVARGLDVVRGTSRVSSAASPPGAVTQKPGSNDETTTRPSMASVRG